MLDQIHWTQAQAVQTHALPPGPGQLRIIASHDFNADAKPLWQARFCDIRQQADLGHWPDHDRILLLVEGGPLKLAAENAAIERTMATGERLYCAGEHQYQAQTSRDSALLLDLLLRRKVAHGCVDLRHGKQQLPLRGGETILFCTNGSFELGLPPYQGGTKTLQSGDVMQMTLDYVPAHRLAITPLQTQSRLLDIRINLFPGHG